MQKDHFKEQKERAVIYRSLPLSAISLTALASFLTPSSCLAYIGPGAGFAFLGSGFVLFLTIGLALITLSLWPLQYLWRKVRGLGVSKNARTRRVVILGLDGLEPSLLEKYMKQGDLPNFSKLAEQGCFERLGTTLPALSPVAWSTFQTGVNPGAHNIFDFLTRDKRYCLPELSSTSTKVVEKKIGFGALSIKRKTAKVELLRRSQPFWKILGKQGIFSNIVRVPVSYPPEKFNGNILSAMCTPDLRGTQGTFALFTTRKHQTNSVSDDINQTASGDATGGEFKQLIKLSENSYKAEIEGPPNPDPKASSRYLSLPIALIVTGSNSATLKIDKNQYELKLHETSSWIELEFRYQGKSISGLARFSLRELSEHVSLYVSPINVNPEKPALPIAHPILFSSWLAKKNGVFGTLGLMEDTWGRNETALDDKGFLQQAYLNHQERELMFFDALERTREGMCACVFDASDRIQHMFWRYLDDKHPAALEDSQESRDAIPNMYRRMDQLLERTLTQIKPDDVLMVISDHGFASFRRGINLNSWLYQNGYLALTKTATESASKEGLVGRDYFKDVDWSRTKAFAVGLSGLYINLKGRERLGVVEQIEAEQLKIEIAAKLEQLRDPHDGAECITRVYDTAKAYRGLYTDQAPDLIVGYKAGYRVSWNSVTGGTEKEVFSDNVKAWSGDHHVDPKSIPGVFLCNRKLKAKQPHIIDLAPTTLDLFAVKIPKYMEGKVLI